MKENKAKIILRIALAILVALLVFSIHAIPLFFGLTWLKGWPEFLGYTLPLAIGISLEWVIVRPLTKNNTKQPRKSYISTAVLLVLLIGSQFQGSFFSHQKIIEKIHSPNGKNTAIIVKWTGRTQAEAYPVIARFFFEDKLDKGIILPSERADWGYTWLDDNTLEFVYNVNDLMDLEMYFEVKVNMQW